MRLDKIALSCCGVCILLILGVASSGGAESLPEVSARPPWLLHDQNQDSETGYALYKRKPIGSDYDAFRLEAIIDSPPGVVAAAAAVNISDPDESQKNLEKKILRDDENGMIVYSYIHIRAPFVADRDVISHVNRSYDAATDTHKISWRATDEGPAPIKGVTRVDRSEGSWTFSPEAGGKTRAVYVSHTEVDGFVPVWIINATMRNTMVQGLKGLRESVDLVRQSE